VLHAQQSWLLQQLHEGQRYPLYGIYYFYLGFYPFLGIDSLLCPHHLSLMSLPHTLSTTHWIPLGEKRIQRQSCSSNNSIGYHTTALLFFVMSSVLMLTGSACHSTTYSACHLYIQALYIFASHRDDSLYPPVKALLECEQV